jgi:hypothetical protein
MVRTAAVALTILSLAVIGGCEKQPTTPPEDAVEEAGGDSAPEEDANEGKEEAAPGLDDKKGGW